MHQPVEGSSNLHIMRVNVLEKMVEELAEIVYEQNLRLRHLEMQGATAERAVMAALNEVLDD